MERSNLPSFGGSSSSEPAGGGTVYRTMERRVGLENVAPSFSIDPGGFTAADRAIGEFLGVASSFFADSQSEQARFHSKDTFLMYHWEAFNALERSLLECLCAFYNVAFILLRSALEMVARGALFQGLSNAVQQEQATALLRCRSGKKLLKFLQDYLARLGTPQGGNLSSAWILDAIAPVQGNKEFQLPTACVIDQLAEWTWLGSDRDSRDDCRSLYGKLSADVHAQPERLDMGRRILTETRDILSNAPQRGAILEYLAVQRAVVDQVVLVELNALGDLAHDRPDVRVRLAERLLSLEACELLRSARYIRALTDR